MNEKDYLRRLEAALSGKLDGGELENLLDYYREYFAEGGEEAASRLEPPETVARKILGEQEDKEAPSPVQKAGKRRWGWITGLTVGAVLLAAVIAVLLIWQNKHRTLKVGVPFVDVSLDLPGNGPSMDISLDLPSGMPAISTGAPTETDDDKIVVSEALEAFDSIVIEGVSDSVTLAAGEGFTLDMRHSPKEKVTYEVRGGTLYLKGEMKTSSTTDFRGGTISITVPEGTTLSTARIETDLGDIALDGVSAHEAELDAALGNVTVSDGTFDSLDCDSDLGDVDVTSVTAGRLDCRAEAGEVSALAFSAGEAELEADLGSVTAQVLGERADYSLELSVDMGEITVDGERVQNPYTAPGGPNRLEAKADLGSVTVSFQP